MRVLTTLKRIILSSLAVALLAGEAETAGPLRDTIRNLFGPDGIILEPGRALPVSRAGDFQVSSLRGLEQLNDQITSTFGVASFNSSVTGFTFDLERGVPIRTTESLGPLLTERAPTLGARRLNVNFSYTRINFTQFQGTDLDNVPLAFAAEDINRNGIIDTRGAFRAESDQVLVDLNLDISEDLFALIATYGLTSYWDVGVVIPVVHLNFRATGRAVIVDKDGKRGGTLDSRNRPVHLFDRNGSSSLKASGGGDATGVGDVIIRTKYNFLTNHSLLPDLSAVAEVKLPTGSRDDLLGTGGTNLTGLLVASKTYSRWFTPHLNLGYVRDTRDTRQSKIRYAVGFDARLLERLTTVADVMGFSKPDGNGVGNNIVDLSLGVKWNPIGFWFLGTNFLIPLNKSSGLRPDFIPTFSVEYIF